VTTPSRPVTAQPPPPAPKELVRQALEDLVLANERDPARRAGVSKADLARALDVSASRVFAILDRAQPNVNLQAWQIVLLPKRARVAVMQALKGEIRRRAALAEAPLSPEARHVRLSRLHGELAAEIETARGPGSGGGAGLDRRERARLRTKYREIAQAANEGAAELDEPAGGDVVAVSFGGRT
jgi:hypothetical protein